MAKVNRNNGNETKSNIFPWDIFKSETISPYLFYQKILKHFSDFLIKISRFYVRSERKQWK